MTVSILRLLGVRPRERGEPGAQLRVGLGGPAPGQRAPRAVEQQCPMFVTRMCLSTLWNLSMGS